MNDVLLRLAMASAAQPPESPGRPGTPTSFLRGSLEAPRASQFTAIHGDNLDPALLQAFIDTVWADLLQRLARPVVVTETPNERIVEILGTVRYCIDRTSGRFRAEELTRRTGTPAAFAPSADCFAVDLPCLPRDGWIEVYLADWWEEMGDVLRDHLRPGDSWLGTVKRIFWQATCRSIHWKQLRHAVRAALALDPEVLAWCRAGRSRQLNFHVDSRQYNRALEHRDRYAQIARDNSRLIWLYTFLLDEGIDLPPGDTLLNMKTWFLSQGMPPAGWRLLTNGRERDFSHIRDWNAEHGLLFLRHCELVDWCCFLVRLRRTRPFPPALLGLFAHDNFATVQPGTVSFRSVRMAPSTFNTIIDEAERRLAKGTLPTFIAGDLPLVLEWLHVAPARLDKNQRRGGWATLIRLAHQWREALEAARTLPQRRWDSCLPTTPIGPWTLVPLTDAWQLREEALRQHHCADSYVDGCLRGNCRLFSIRNSHGRRVATLGLSLNDDRWTSFGLHGPANTRVPPSLWGIDDQVAIRYTDLWRATQPLAAACEGSAV